MAIQYAHGKTTSRASMKVEVSALLGIIVLLVVGLGVSWRLAALLAWDSAALVYALWIWISVWSMNGALTTSHAQREDPSRGTANVVVLTASVASLAAVGFVLAGAANAHGSAKLLEVALGVVSVVIGWVVVHTIFALNYAELYYSGKPGGVEFGGVSQPSYKDFAYLAFTIGMTFQVSDTGFQSTMFRRVGLRHAMFSYLFGTIIVATTINLIAGLTK